RNTRYTSSVSDSSTDAAMREDSWEAYDPSYELRDILFPLLTDGIVYLLLLQVILHEYPPTIQVQKRGELQLLICFYTYFLFMLHGVLTISPLSTFLYFVWSSQASPDALIPIAMAGE